MFALQRQDIAPYMFQISVTPNHKILSLYQKSYTCENDLLSLLQYTFWLQF